QVAGEDLCRVARDRGGRVRSRDQGRQSEKRRFSTESGGVHRGGASGHGRYGQKRPGRGAAVANEPCSFRLFGQLKTLGISFLCIVSYRPVCPFQFQSPATTNQRNDKIKNENEITTIQERDLEQAGREKTGNEGPHGCHRPRRQGSRCFCARRASRWDAHPWPRRARLPLECE